MDDIVGGPDEIGGPPQFLGLANFDTIISNRTYS